MGKQMNTWVRVRQLYCTRRSYIGLSGVYGAQSVKIMLVVCLIQMFENIHAIKRTTLIECVRVVEQPEHQFIEIKDRTHKINYNQYQYDKYCQSNRVHAFKTNIS